MNMSEAQFDEVIDVNLKVSKKSIGNLLILFVFTDFYISFIEHILDDTKFHSIFKTLC